MPDIIDTLMGLDDAALSTKIGQDKILSKFKSDLADAAALPEAQRIEAAERIDRLINPTPDARDIGWMVDDLQREARRDERKSAKAEIEDSDPDSLATLAPPIS